MGVVDSESKNDKIRRKLAKLVAEPPGFEKTMRRRPIDSHGVVPNTLGIFGTKKQPLNAQRVASIGSRNPLELERIGRMTKKHLDSVLSADHGIHRA